MREATRERLPILIFKDSSVSRAAAQRVADFLASSREQSISRPVLGLFPDPAVIEVCKHLIAMHENRTIDLSTAIIFEWGEYYGLESNSLHSLHGFLTEFFYDSVGIDQDHVYYLRTDTPPDEVESHCLEFEMALREHGGLGILLLGLSAEGKIAFNEVDANLESRTRLIGFDDATRTALISEFSRPDRVPWHALCAGIATTLDAREIIVVASGVDVAPVVQRLTEEETTPALAVSFCQAHPNTFIYIDWEAASELTRVRAPWQVGQVLWNTDLTGKAVLWLAEEVKKAIPLLDTADFHQNYLSSLARTTDVDATCHSVFQRFNSQTVEAQTFFAGQRVLILTPFPGLELISMAGALDLANREAEQVVVACLGDDIATVTDEDVMRYLWFIELNDSIISLRDSSRRTSTRPLQKSTHWSHTPDNWLRSAGEHQSGQDTVRAFKANVRRAEALAAYAGLDVHPKTIQFLALPFSQANGIRRVWVSEDDIQIIHQLIEELNPHMIFLPEHRLDRRGVIHAARVAADLALIRYQESDADRVVNCIAYTYPPDWAQRKLRHADLVVPLYATGLSRKLRAIRQLVSLESIVAPPEDEERHPWERSSERDKMVARSLINIGLPHMAAAEVFALHQPHSLVIDAVLPGKAQTH